MDKVDLGTASLLNPSLLKGLKQETKKTENKKIPGRKEAGTFSHLMESSNAELGPIRSYAPSEEALTVLMDAVHSAGSDLLDRPFQDEILDYKKAVRNFLNYVVENCYGIKTSQTGLREIRKLKPHVQIQVIDQKLEELAASILMGQTDKLKLVSQLDDIRGLLVDLTISGVIKERDD